VEKRLGKMVFTTSSKQSENATSDSNSKTNENCSNSKIQTEKPIPENKFLYYVEEFIFQYILIIKKIEIYILDFLKNAWRVLTSREALKVYSIIGQILLYSLIVTAIIFLILGLNNRSTPRRQRRRRY
jgi:hypothetical protein